ncbi:hypothetical protein M409DRAFT_26586 [Zasmidium cellare ATCC 36951]|uniref:PHD-type domain-containing protein n=1 Tax=Zasmidium cellare ATCC 36951 TaxID=1080233 RepID=A0A6A6C7Y5_ZASCE|nr:uncharacterized protein M409DRAFT_26586 [Zasmidium cellare ATCC 36951]KAF2163141.1 hypothetical protein M409DRAFT_26586 [Zasmidium cellare ATCC 36951]
MPPITRGAKTPRRHDNLSIFAQDKLGGPIESPGSENLQLPTPTPSQRKRKRAPQEDEFVQFARSLIADDTAVALRVAGCGGDSTETASDGKWCLCGMAEEDIVDLEYMIRCDNRQCNPGWFHLRCVKLPSQPPSRFGWFCKDCLKACNVGEAINGLICQRGEDGSTEVRDWLVEQQSERDTRRKRRQLKKMVQDASDGSEGDVDE